MFAASPQEALAVPYRTSIAGAIQLCVIGSAAAVTAIRLREDLSVNDDLGLITLTYVSIVSVLAAGGFLFLGLRWWLPLHFPSRS